MDYRQLGTTGLEVSAVGLGTWVMGGWMWGGADDKDSLAAIREALDLGINLIDTAPAYGHGRAEELVGQALRDSGCRKKVVLATKMGLEWDGEKNRFWRNSSRLRVQEEVELSLRRLKTEYIDLYQIHWPDGRHPFEETMEALLDLQQQEKIRFIGISNFNVAQIEQCLAVGPVVTAQPPYNLFERGIEAEILPFCRSRKMGTLIYGPLCRGLLSGKYRGDETFSNGDIRAVDPKFNGSRFQDYLACGAQLKEAAFLRGKTLVQLAVRWCLDQKGVDVALCGARTPQQIFEIVGATGWTLSASESEDMVRVVDEIITAPIGSEFMSPP